MQQGDEDETKEDCLEEEMKADNLLLMDNPITPSRTPTNSTCDDRCTIHGACVDGRCFCSEGWNGKHCTLPGLITYTIFQWTFSKLRPSAVAERIRLFVFHANNYDLLLIENKSKLTAEFLVRPVSLKAAK